MTSWKESPGLMMPLFGAAAGAIYGATKEREKRPLVFAAVGAGVSVVLGVFMGSMTPGQDSHRVGAATSAEIFKAQLQLARIGYPVDPTGVLDAQTRASLKKFQEAYALLVRDGTVTPETLAYLASLETQHVPWTPESGPYKESIVHTT